ncbi:MAG TPA: DinB family protein [Polyangia bacterium]|nr:DinB family protein [Polyangia bacterium]
MRMQLPRCLALVFVVSTIAIGSHARAAAGSFQEDWLGQLGSVEKKLMSLEEATPPNKMSWRPDKGIRSFSEVYLHAAYGNYGFLKSMGFDPPADAGFGADAGKWDKQTVDKEQIKKIMEKSFEHVRATVKALSDADVDKKVKMFGKFEMTERAALLMLLGHLNEHMGQLVAYARMNKIVPPWSKTGA